MHPWREHALENAAGSLVVFERPGPTPTAPTVLLLHGFTGCHLGWRRVSEYLPEARVLAPDLPGHGASRFADEERACRMDEATRRLAMALDRLDVHRCALAGYSMGGRLALYFALTQPWRFDALLLESASPGLASEKERAERRRADEALAGAIERDGVAAFLARWQQTPVLASQRELPVPLQLEADAERQGNRAAGLAASLRGMGTGAQPWLGDRLHALNLPVTCVAGSLDAKFTAIATHMAERIPGARLEIIRAGHNVHLEHPKLIASLIFSNAESQRRRVGRAMDSHTEDGRHVSALQPTRTERHA